jgi:hypothetical protein
MPLMSFSEAWNTEYTRITGIIEKLEGELLEDKRPDNQLPSIDRLIRQQKRDALKAANGARYSLQIIAGHAF